MVQDKLGFLWIGTGDGLCRYDGYRFKIYKHDAEDTNSIAGNSIRSLYVDSKDRLWIGVRAAGVDMLDLVTGKFTHYRYTEGDKTGLSDSEIAVFCEGDNDELWIGTIAGGINVLNTRTGKFLHFNHDSKDPFSLSNDRIRAIVRDNKKRFWIGTWSGGVNCYDPSAKKFIRYQHENDNPNSLCYDKVRSMYCDSKGRIWIGTWLRGIDVFDPATGEFICATSDTASFLGKLDAGMIWNMCEDKEGKVWIATAEKGLISVDPSNGTTSHYRHDQSDPFSISDDNVWSVMIDRSGIIWAGTMSAGISYYNPASAGMEHYHNEPRNPYSLANNTVWSFFEMRSGKVLIGTSAGVSIYDPAKKIFEKYAYKPDEKNAWKDASIVQCLLETRNGKIWMGTNGGGVNIYDPSTDKYSILVNKWDDENSLSNNSVQCLYEDSEGIVWIGTSGAGLDRYDPALQKFTHYMPDPKNPSSITGFYISDVMEDKKGMLWVATADGGLCIFDKKTGKFTGYRHDPANRETLSNDNVLCIHFDRSGNAWLGTNNGLNYFNTSTGKFTVFNTKHGLPNEIIYGILEDRHGSLWVSTNRGLAMFNPLEKKVKIFDVSDGLQSIEFNQGSAMKAKDGKMYFGGIKGFNSFYPEKIASNTTIPNVVITSFSVLNKPYVLPKDISHTSEIDLTYRDYFFSLEFAATEFSNPARNGYRYKMEGFDEDWVNAGDRRFVTYTNLDPGEYIFRVIASNNHGVWNEEGTSLKIIIAPPFWRTWWFYTLCGFMAVGGIYSYILMRERKLVKERNILEEKVNLRTRELREEKEKVDAAHKDIRDSINYAKRIQEAILPINAEFKKALPHSFVMLRPRDVVSGDFYWFARKEHRVYFAVVDCTGHGVPGAFMSMIGNTLLNEIVNEKGTAHPSAILDMLHEGVTNALKQDKQSAETRDGMDVALCCFDAKNNTLEYAGANRPLYLVTGDLSPGRLPSLEEIKADKQPIGGANIAGRKPFTNHFVSISAGDSIYIFTDGYIDQFGGDKGKKFMAKRFQDMLISIRHMSMEEQRDYIDKEFSEWKNGLEQVDDVCVIGVRF